MYVIYLTKDVTSTNGYNGEKRIKLERGYPHMQYGGIKKFESERGAKISCAALNRRCAKKFEEFKNDKYSAQHAAAVYAVLSYEEWDKKYNPMVERVNLMSQKPYMEKLYTSRCVSPSSELYWTM